MRNAIRVFEILGTTTCVALICCCTVTLAQEKGEPLPDPGVHDPVVSGPVAPFPTEFVHSPEPLHMADYGSIESTGQCNQCQSTSACRGGRCHRCQHNGPIKQRWHGHWKPWLHENHWGYPENFVAEPHGASIYAHFNAQVGNGQAAQLALYHFDFHDGLGKKAAKLNSYGVDRLTQLSGLLMQSGLPLVIQRTQDNPQLDQARRAEVIDQLARVCPAPIEPERVIVGRPIALGLDARESALIYLNLLKQTQRGEGLGTGSSSTGGFTPTQGFTPRGN